MTAANPRLRLLLPWLALIGVEVLTQLALKFAGQATGAFDFSRAAFARAVSDGWMWLAVACYVAGFLAWMLILRQMRLSHAYPASAIVFVAVMLSSWLFLHEAITVRQWIGAAIIVAGILQLGSRDHAAGVPPTPIHPPE